MDEKRDRKLPVLVGDRKPAKLTPLQRYLKEISKYALLSPEEEHALAKLHFEEEDIKAAHQLITANLRFVVKIANEFRGAQVHLLDLIQEGNYGLMQAVKRFNPYKGVKLSSYASWWIRAYILKYLLDNKSQVKIATTASQRKLFYNLQKETDKLLSEYETADPAKIAKRLNVSEKDVVEMQKRLLSPEMSLDAPIGEDGGAYRDLLADDKNISIEEALADKQVQLIFSQHLEEFKEQLKGRDREIFDLRLSREKPKTLQEIGDMYGITRERVRQIEIRIIRKLKDFVKEKGTLDI